MAVLLAFAAGTLSVLSPCVLPLLPIVGASALQQGRLGPVALALGMALSFASMGVLLGLAGASIGLASSEVARLLGAAAMIALGSVLLVARLSSLFASWTEPLAGWVSERLGHVGGNGLGPQFLIGALLGIVWSPCTGPVLGAAMGMTTQVNTLVGAISTMLAFGLGSATPLLLLAYGAQHSTRRWRERASGIGSVGRRALGGLLMATGTLVLTGTDRVLEAVAVAHTPAWLVDLSTAL